MSVDGAVEIQGLSGSKVTITAEALTAFKTGFRGPVVTAEDASYEELRKVWNAMIDRRPALFVRCTGPADVAHAIKFVREHRLASSVRGGGHNIAGLSMVEGGLVIDMALMKGVWVDPKARTARAQAGCLLGDLDRETQAHGLAAVLGFVSQTGIAGLTVGGGFGYLTRKYGWTCDNVISMDVVTASGEIVRAAADENEDLFFALRGGSGNFGIVTSFEYKLFPVGPQILGGAVAWRAEDAPEVLKFYQELTASAPRELTCVAVLRIAPPAPWLPKEIHGKPIIVMFVCYSGPLEEGEKLVAPIKAFGKPVADILVKRPYAQMQSMLDATQPKGRRYYWKSEYVAGLSSNLLETVIAQARGIPSPHGGVILFHLGGALNELPPEHSPVGNRKTAFVVNLAGSWDNAADDEVNLKWARDAWQAVRPFSTGVYVNFLTEEEGADRVEAAYGKAMLERLAPLKKKYDPDNVFQHTKRIS
jgi:FAD/FMN-containing dehydrogenase